MRSVPRDNEAVNEAWLSDRDRYSHTGLRAADRVTMPLLRDGATWREATWDDALARTVELLRAQAGDELGVLVNPATSNEEGALLARIAAHLGSGNIDHRLRTADFADAPVASTFEMPLAEVEKAGAVLLIGCNPRHEAPLLGHRIRKTATRGGKVFALNPIDFDFNFEVKQKRIVAPNAMVDALLSLAKAAGEGGSATPPAGTADALGRAESDDFAKAMTTALRDASSSVIILGESALNHPQASWLRAIARHLAASVGARVNELPQGANAIGLARNGVLPSKLDAAAMLAQPRRAYVLYGVDPVHDLADQAAALRAFAQSSVIAFSAFADDALKRVAHVILPIALTPEIDGTLTNVDGVDQRVSPSIKPPGESRAGWRVLRALGEKLAAPGFGFIDFAELRVGLAPADAPASGGSLAERNNTAKGEQGLQRIATSAIYRTDAVLRRAAPLNAHTLTRGARVVLHPDDAATRELTDGGLAKVDDGRGTATVPVTLSARVPRGGAWIETGYDATAPIAGPGAILNVTRA